MLDKKKISFLLKNEMPSNHKYRIYFEDLSLNGLEDMHKYSVDERFYEFFEYKPFVEINETEEYINKLLKRMDEPEDERTCKYWFIRDKETKGLIGTACLKNIHYLRSSLELAYGIDPELWGKGYILEIQECLKKYVFEKLGFNRLWGITLFNNERTKKSVLAAGFKNEGIAKHMFFKNGQFIDGWFYGLTKDDYFSKDIYIKKKKVSKQQIIKVVNSVLLDCEVTELTSMENTVEWDSLSHMSIIAELSLNFEVELTPSQIVEATSIDSLDKLINQN